ncbi:hypothetical protein WJX73_009697 [Symbiochloris irregularis]|uniref:Prohibitin n=1 Tax=Symbiochloris irregularis TaxID=706552 RepID=A0AAW1NQJ3_9CHLO
MQAKVPHVAYRLDVDDDSRRINFAAGGSEEAQESLVNIIDSKNQPQLQEARLMLAEQAGTGIHRLIVAEAASLPHFVELENR